MSKIRAVRLSSEEEQLIQNFLSKNTLFDFTTLVRAALREFIHNPHMRLKAVDSEIGHQITPSLKQKHSQKELSQ